MNAGVSVKEARMFYWVCVNDKPVALPTGDVESAKRLALDHIGADPSARVQIDVYSRNSDAAKLRYDSTTARWIDSDALAP